MSVPLSRDEAVERLARRLHWKMEHLDPTDDADWDLLTDHQKEFYRTCVRSLMVERQAVLAVIR